jgi:hypothetical protein
VDGSVSPGNGMTQRHPLPAGDTKTVETDRVSSPSPDSFIERLASAMKIISSVRALYAEVGGAENLKKAIDIATL